MAVKSRPKSMPKWRPAPASLIQQFAGAVERIPSVEQRKMFGYPAAFLNGNMFAGLFQDHVVVRLSVEDRAELGRTAGARPFEPMPGRPMREYLVVPEAVVDSVTELPEWLERARRFAASLPAKQAAKKGKKPSPTRKGRGR